MASTSEITISSSAPISDGHPFPTILVSCIARSTDATRYPSVFLYKSDPRNPKVEEGMRVRLWGDDESTIRRVRHNIVGTHSISAKLHALDLTELEGRVEGVRGVDRNHIEFWVVGVASSVAVFAYLVVPINMAKISGQQLRMHRFVRNWIPQTIDNAEVFEDICEAANQIRGERDQDKEESTLEILKRFPTPARPPPFFGVNRG